MSKTVTLLRIPLITLLLTLVYPSVSLAATLHSNPFTEDTTFEVIWFIVSTFQQKVADDFQIDAGDAVVENVQFWITVDTYCAEPTGFLLQFYASHQSQDRPGELIQALSTTDFSIKRTEFTLNDHPVYEINIHLTPEDEFNAAQGVRYWIAFTAIPASNNDCRVGLAMDSIPIGKQANIWIVHKQQWITVQEATSDKYGPADGFFSLSGSVANSLNTSTWAGVKNSF